MKRFLCIFILSSYSIFAQKVLINLNKVGSDTSKVYSSIADTLINPGPAGASKTWDFGYLTYSDTSIYLNKSYDPSSISGASNFPDATIAIKGFIYQEEDGSLVESDSTFGFFKQTANEIFILGGVFIAEGQSQLTGNFKYNKPYKIAVSPFNYGNSYTSIIEGTTSTTSFGVPLNSTQQGATTTTYDGYGNILLPGTSVPVACSRIFEEEIYNDTTSTTILGQSIKLVTRYINKTYSFTDDETFYFSISNQTKIEFDETLNSDTTNSSDYSFESLNYRITSINNGEKNISSTVLLSPTATEGVINLSGLNGRETTYSVLDQSGKVQKNGSIYRQEESINVTLLPAGVYTLLLQSQDGMAIKRFIKL